MKNISLKKCVSVLLMGVSLWVPSVTFADRQAIENVYRAGFSLGYASTDISGLDPAVSYKFSAEHFVDRRVAMSIDYHGLVGFEHATQANTSLDFPALVFCLSGYSDWKASHRYFINFGFYYMTVGGEVSNISMEDDRANGLKLGFGYERRLAPNIYLHTGAERYFSISHEDISGEITIDNFFLGLRRGF
jgi:hypothetical protein